MVYLRKEEVDSLLKLEEDEPVPGKDNYEPEKDRRENAERGNDELDDSVLTLGCYILYKSFR